MMPKKLKTGIWIASPALSVDKKKPAKKKAKKIVKPPVPPVRPSPFKLGDEVWRPKGSYMTTEWIKGKILKCSRPVKNGPWTYTFGDGEDFGESELIPQKVFHMIATDAIKLKRASFEDALNDAFDGQVAIFGVYRSGQRRPWSYYVFPGGYLEAFGKSTTYTDTTFGGEQTGYLWKATAEEQELKLLPISSHPREILTYLGIHVYSRLWMKKENNGSQEDS